MLKEQLLQDIRSGSASPVKKEHQPRHARAPVWDHLAIYDDPKFVYCTKCCPAEVSESLWNKKGVLKRNKSQSTTNMLQHLEQMHGIFLRKPADSDDKKQTAIASYGQNQLNKYYRAMSLATAVNLYPMRMWENFRDVVTLLNPSLPPPSGKVVRRFLDELMADEATRLKDCVLKKLTASLPMVSLEIDMWPSPAHGHFFGCWLHGITADWQAVSLLLHCQRFGAIPHTSANQAQRLRSAVATMVGMEVDNLAYILASDNAPDAAGVCRLLGLESGRCGAHIIALAAAHLNFPVLRQKSLVMHERAIPEARLGFGV